MAETVTDTHVRCPFCGREDRDAWEIDGPPGEAEECTCGALYAITEIELVCYYTVVPVRPAPSDGAPSREGDAK